MVKFRFEDLEIWKKAIEVENHFYELADSLKRKEKYRFAEQLHGSALSFSNKIAEGAGGSDKEFDRYLSIARSSVYELANMLKVFGIRGYIEEEELHELMEQLDHLSRQITKFKKQL